MASSETSPAGVELRQILALVMEQVAALQVTNEALRQDILRLCLEVAELKGKPRGEPLITATECAKLLGRNPSTISAYKKEHWLQGIHYFPQGPAKTDRIMYSSEAVQHWQKHRLDPQVHQQWCEEKIRERQAA